MFFTILDVLVRASRLAVEVKKATAKKESAK